MKHGLLLWTVLGIVLGLCGPSIADAEGLFQVLPKDAAWATYNVRIVNRATKTEETGTFTVTILGSETRKDVVYRRMQFKLRVTSSDKPETATLKALVPEKQLLTSHDYRAALSEVIVSTNGKTLEADSKRNTS